MDRWKDIELEKMKVNSIHTGFHDIRHVHTTQYTVQILHRLVATGD